MLPDSVGDICEGLDAGGYDAATLMDWYWRLHQKRIMANIPSLAYSLDNLSHEVTQHMSKCLSPIAVEVERIVPSKEELDWHRLERARVDDADPIVVLGWEQEGMRIPDHSDHRFRFIPITDSDGFRSLIPTDFDQ